MSSLGAGGMGEVYRATDTNLKRTVAIKVLPDSMATDSERLARFQREAEMLARLNHPQIAQIYGLEKVDGTAALVMELVEGQTLAERMAQGPIPVDEALAISKQIADALEAAHEQGVIHRDLKPANIKVRSDGTVKILDFGLAKMLVGFSSSSGSSGASGSSGSASLANSPTITSPAMTPVGMILGTAAYMSPEQAKGRPVDRRADVWAFACVIYEMLTGRRAFAGDDVTEVLASVIKSEPDWTLLPHDVSRALRLHLQRALMKDPRARVQSVGDLRLAIEGAFDSDAAIPVPARATRSSSLRQLAWGAAGLVVGIGLALVAVNLRPAPPPSRLSRFDIAPPQGFEYAFSGAYVDVTISPDGSRVVYGARNPGIGGLSIVARPLDQLLSTPLRDVNGESPFTSPNGQWVGFVSNSRLRKAPAQGGTAIAICDIPGALRGAAWTEDDTIVFGAGLGSGLWQVPAGGGQPRQITKPELGDSHGFPEALPGGKAVLFTIWSGSFEGPRVAAVDVAGGSPRVLVQAGSSPKYVKTGHIVYADRGALRAVGFDAD